MRRTLDLSLVVLGATLVTRGSAHAKEDPLPPCGEQALELFEAERHIEAARTAEACWASRGDPRLMYFAAQARQSAGHTSHAVMWYRRYLAQLPTETPQHKRVQERLDALMDKVVAVTIEAPAGALTFAYKGRPDRLDIEWDGGEGTVYLEPGEWRVFASPDWLVEHVFQVPTTGRVVVRSAPAAPPLPKRVPVLVNVSPARALGHGARIALRADSGTEINVALYLTTTQLSVLPGQWRVTLNVPDRETIEQEILLRGPAELSFQPSLSRTTRARIGLGAGLGAVGLGLGLWGASWVARGRREAAARLWGAPLDSILQSYSIGMDGSAVLSAAAGAVTVGITDAVGLRRLPVAVETGIGAGLAIAGAIWRSSAKRTMTEKSSEIALSDDGFEYPLSVQYWQLLREQQPREAAAAMMFGFGLGSSIAGAISLITMTALGRGPDRVRRLEPMTTPTALGIQGRF